MSQFPVRHCEPSEEQSRSRSTTLWLLTPRMLWPLDCFVARAPRNDGWVAADPIASVVIGRRPRIERRCLAGPAPRDRAPFLRHSAGRTRHRLVDRLRGGVCEVLGEVDPDEDDLGLGGAKSFREAFARGEHVGAGTGRERHADNARVRSWMRRPIRHCEERSAEATLGLRAAAPGLLRYVNRNKRLSH